MTDTGQQAGRQKLRRGSLVFGLAVGLAVAFFSYQWITDSAKRHQRQQQEQVVLAARFELRKRIGESELEIVDPLAPLRRVGKVYVYPASDGWEVSGYYRRPTVGSREDRWHPFLMSLGADGGLVHLKVQDSEPGLVSAAAVDERLEVVP